MATKLQCKSCGKEKKTFSSYYHRCSKHGVFCSDCVAKAGWGIFGSYVCPKCGGEVKKI